ncbi:MAG: hypothetical protein MUQ00_02920, partial [Candidatus Aminicenantes bacterium]|nr:hypothetical protein [Candidatus Aminicenantes bacterium]
MRIVFDPDFDGGCWPGPLRANPPRVAAVGEAWVGPYLFQKILETALGLGGLVPSQSERIISLAKAVRSQEGFWSRSAEKDPIGVARTLLRWLDWLKMHGWDGQAPPLSAKAPRLSDLSKLIPSVPPGTPDYLNAILAALDKRRPDIASVETYEPIDRLLPIWREIFAKLEARGIRIKYWSDPLLKPDDLRSAAPFSADSLSASDSSAARSSKKAPFSSAARTAAHAALSASSASSDLRRALTPGFVPAGDGSLLLFRPYNPLDAAE